MSEASLSMSDAANAGLDALFGTCDDPPDTREPDTPGPHAGPHTGPHTGANRADPAEDAALCALVARIAQSDSKALATLYDMTVGRVFGLARGITRNLACAEEVTEDVYWQVWRQALRFDRRRGSVMAWLLTLARSRALDHWRKRDPALAHPEPHTLADEPGDAEADPARCLVGGERARHLQAAFEHIEPLPRQLLTLAFYRGLSHDEIAQQTRLPLGTVKSHLRRAMNTLRGLLAGNGLEPGTPAP